MILYHGTNKDIDKINLKIGSAKKDFGQGFYLTPNLTSAKKMAVKKAKKEGGKPIVISYEINDNCLTSKELRIKEFPEKASGEWIMFIYANRNAQNAGKECKYDIIIGPIADDGVALQLTNLRLNLITKEQAAILIRDKYLDIQYCIKTEKAVEKLKKIRIWEVGRQKKRTSLGI